MEKTFPVVGVGASAGGVEAFTQLLSSLPADTGMAFVLIQHLDPTHASMLPEIVARSTQMQVLEVKSGMPVQPNHVYVIPPNTKIGLSDEGFQLLPRPKTRGRELPIDYFFESLAETYKMRAIGVILSGTLSDGALGLKAIKSEGGITFAQDETARFPDMPRAAVAAGSVDSILPPEGIARELERIGRHPFVVRAFIKNDDGVAAPAKKGRAPSKTDELQSIFQLLRSATGVDFSRYRPTTIRRRISRRMVLNRVEELDDYLRMLKSKPAEVHRLYEDILITVTGFFRDPEMYQVLEATVFPTLVRNRPADAPIRIWVPGCSTGEEVYSIAISLFESMGETGMNPPVQIFATDISETAIEKARSGIYLENALVEISPKRLRRFFTRTDGGYQISKSIRDVCIFARQNVAVDPPFSNLDLISCRNLLIYLEPGLQKRIVPLFHYALKPQGYLMLGSSETLTTFPDLFSPVDRQHRIFVKRPGARPFIDFGHRSPMKEEAREDAGPGHQHRHTGLDLQREADRMVLNRYAPAGVIVNDALDIVQFRGKTSPFLESASGTPSLNLLKMAREGLLVELRSAVVKARKTGSRVRKEGIPVRQNGGVQEISLDVVPLREGHQGATYYLVLFEETHRKSGRREARPTPRALRIRDDQAIVKLEQELAVTKEYLQSIIEEHEAANEELKSANEEILSSNEELQSTNEELETAKEELQSTNEELQTVNEELHGRNLELKQLNNDLVNLLAGINMAVVMVGLQGQIRRYTSVAEKLLNIIPTDIGRPIGDLKPNLDAPDIGEFVNRVIATVTPMEREVQSKEGNWYSMRIRPYRTLDNRIDGAVLAFMDIDPLKRTIEQASRSRAYAEALVETVRESLVVLDENLRVRTANRAFYQTFQASPINTEGQFLFDLGGEWGEGPPPLKILLEEAVEKRESVRDFEFDIDFAHLGRKTLVANARPVKLAGEPASLILLALEDITERKIAVEELEASEAQYRRLFETAREGIWILDARSGKILEANPFVTELLGFEESELVGKLPWQLPIYPEPRTAERRFHALRDATFDYEPDLAMTTKDGRTLLVEAISSAYVAGNRNVVQCNMRDLTERRRLEDELRQVQKLESIGRLAGGIAHDFNNILNIISAYGTLLAKGGDATKRSQSADAIDKAVQRGAALVRQLLTFARRDGTRFEKVDLNALLRELASMVSETFPKSIRIDVELDPDVPPIKADPNQLHQALLNLCVNARDAMPEGGELKLATAVTTREKLQARFPEATEDRYACIGVSDKGQGMDDQTRNRIFEPFFTTKKAEQGSGLGLAVVYGVVNAHSGFIDVVTEKGTGTSFSIYLPVRSFDEERPAPEDQQVATAAVTSETILVVEDEELLLDSLKSLIEAEGFRVLTARDGIEAIETFEKHREDVGLVLADLGLPRLGGWEALARMRKLKPEIRAIVASGTLDLSQRAEMRRSGVQTTIRKPYTAAEMLGAIRQALRPLG